MAHKYDFIELYETEVGAVTDLLSMLENAKTSKESKKLLTSIKSFLSSMSVVRRGYKIPSYLQLVAIERKYIIASNDVKYTFILEGDYNDSIVSLNT